MKKLFELLRLNKTEGDFGIEIECEGKNLHPVMDNVWNTVADGSLRGPFPTESCEWVLARPLVKDAAIKALHSLAEANKEATLNFSFRTSVHVHVNVQQLTFPEYMAMIYTYLLVEEPMMRFCGEQRIGNRFCLRIQDAEGFLDHLEDMAMRGPGAIARIQEDAVRYASINIAATRKYGSLEFRGMRGTLDVNVLSTWIEAINRIREFALKMGSPTAVHDLFVKSRVEDFAKEVFGDLANTFFYPQVIDDVRRSFSLTLNIPYAYSEYAERAARQELLEKRVAKPKMNAILDEIGRAPRFFENIAREVDF